MDSIEIKEFKSEHISEVSKLFLKELSQAFSANLGLEFLEKIYFPYFFSKKESIGFIAFAEGRLVGFILASDDKGFYGLLIKKNPIIFLRYCFKVLVKKPWFLFYIFSICFVAGASLPIQTKKNAELLYMAVDRDYQRREIGKKLLESLENRLNEKKYYNLVVQTLLKTPNAQKFYLKNDFIKIKKGWGRIWFVKKVEPFLITQKQI
ncbi:GNAT family N-acetyltransferase [bacterium]|nr:GNAT family N-acetyltransferase [bacterium]